MRKYTQPTIFVFAALLMVMPLANSNAFGQSTGISNLNPSCGIDVPGSIDMGSISDGADGIEEVISTINATGTQSSILDVVAGDWEGVGSNATGVVTLVNVASSETITLNGLVYTAVTGTKSGNTQFSIDTSDSAAATDLTASINADTRSGTTDDISAEVFDNVIVVYAATVGTGGNAITMAEAVTDAGTTVSGSTLSGAENAGIVHMQAETTKYAITTDSTSSTGATYAQKTNFAADSVSKVLSSTVTPANEVSLSLQVSGDGTLENMSYSGTLTQTLTFTATCI